MLHLRYFAPLVLWPQRHHRQRHRQIGRGRAQQQAQVRYFTEFDSEQKSNVVDVFIQGVSHLGEMTEAEFHGDFDYPGKPEAEPVTGTSVENNTDSMADPAPEITDSEPLTETPVEDVTKDDN